jgi:O-antigen/teichoic acid export membrane protein
MRKAYVRITGQVGFSYFMSILTFFISPLLILLLTRNLSVAEYGVYALLAVTINVASVLLDLGLSQYILSQLAGSPLRQRVPAFLSLSAFLLMFLLLLIGIVWITPLDTVLLRVLKLTDYASEFHLGLAVIFCTTFIRLCAAYLMAQKRIILVNLLAPLGQALWVILLLGYYLATGHLSVISVMTWWLVGTLLTLLFCIGIVQKEFVRMRPARMWRPQAILTGLLFSFPLLISQIGSWVIEIGDRYMLNSMLNSEAVGLYTLVYSLLGVVAMLGTIIAITFFPYIASSWNQKRTYQVYVNIALKYALIILLPALAGFFLLREQIITLVSGTTYHEATRVVPALLAYPLLSVLSYLCYQIVLLQKKTVFIGVTYGISAALNIGLNFVLIPRFQMIGAAIATVASYAFMVLALGWSAAPSLRVTYSFLKLERVIFATAVMGLAIWLVQPAVVWTKILTVIGGALLYFSLAFLLGVFSWKEINLFAGLVPARLRFILPLRWMQRIRGFS